MVDQSRDDFVDSAVSKFSSKYRNAKVRGAIFKALMHEIFELHEAIKQVEDNLWLDTAEGVQIDKNGLMIGLERPLQETDEVYRSLQFAKIGINNSDGLYSRICEIWSFLTSESGEANPDATIFDTHYGGISFQYSGNLSSSRLELIKDNLPLMLRLGIRVADITNTPENACLFSGTNVYGQGFDDGVFS